MSLTTALLALLAFQTKHFLCDFVLQTLWQINAKKHYGRPGGLVHAGLHGLFSVPVLLFFTTSPALIALVAAGEAVLHYHIDYAKARIDAATGWSYQDRQYWALFGADQLLHQLTYLGIVAGFAA